MLYIIATPIGNLGDITYRAVQILNTCDYLLAEDTRHSRILLDYYQIQKPLHSFHLLNEKKKLEKVVADLKNNGTIGLVSDAGTPILCDPGHILVQECIRNNLPFTAVPGPSSIVQGLVLSGLSPVPFQFVGFVPKKKRRIFFQKMLFYEGTSLAFESPQRILSTLQEMAKIDPQRDLVIAREMTKKFEECLRGTPQKLIDHFIIHPPKGEIVLITAKKELPFDSLSLEEIISILHNNGYSDKEALMQAASIKQIPKKEAYKKLLAQKKL
ncbi:MAG: 16S rRNA (cytidine(1402)-2'-O)-methyltransferase [Parachlamydiales bacterium]|nr:16S rRNA (cytidine(1402)-2'-O)-methyltransferase [Parachlamydiales bacterium]